VRKLTKRARGKKRGEHTVGGAGTTKCAGRDPALGCTGWRRKKTGGTTGGDGPVAHGLARASLTKKRDTEMGERKRKKKRKKGYSFGGVQRLKGPKRNEVWGGRSNKLKGREGGRLRDESGVVYT